MFVLSAKWHTMWHKMEILKSKYLKTVLKYRTCVNALNYCPLNISHNAISLWACNCIKKEKKEMTLAALNQG